MRKMLLWLAVLLLAVGMAMAEALPPPDGTGEWIGTETWDDGVTYQVYLYEYKKNTSTTGLRMPTYTGKAKRGGYTVTQMPERSTGNILLRQTDWYTVTDGRQTAYIAFESGYFATSETITLYVPEGMEFVLNPEQERPEGRVTYSFGDAILEFDVTEFGFQNGSFFDGSLPGGSFQNDSFFDGTLPGGSFQNDIFQFGDAPSTGSGPTRCDACKGTGKCGTCGGKRSWKNPYTGDWLECNACTDGTCTICDGKGYWD